MLPPYPTSSQHPEVIDGVQGKGALWSLAEQVGAPSRHHQLNHTAHPSVCIYRNPARSGPCSQGIFQRRQRRKEIITEQCGKCCNTGTYKIQRWPQARVSPLPGLEWDPQRKFPRRDAFMTESWPLQFSSVAQSSLTLCNAMDGSTLGFPAHHQLPELARTHVHGVGDAIQPSHPLLLPSPAFNLSHYQGLSQLVSSLHQVAKVLELQLQHQPFQWIFRTDFLQDGLVGYPCYPRDSQESSPTPQFKSINSSTLSFPCDPTLASIHNYWKNHSFD